MTEFDAKEKAGLVVEILFAGDDEAKKALADLEDGEAARLVNNRTKSLEAQAFDFFLIFRRLFVNLILSYKAQDQPTYFLDREDVTNSPAKAFQVIEVELNFIYDMVYTKALSPTARRAASSASSPPPASSPPHLLLPPRQGQPHARRHRHHLCAAPRRDSTRRRRAGHAPVLHRMLVFLEKTRWLAWISRSVRSVRPQLRRWSERTSQLNLVSYCLGKPDRSSSGLRGCLGGPQMVRRSPGSRRGCTSGRSLTISSSSGAKASAAGRVWCRRRDPYLILCFVRSRIGPSKPRPSKTQRRRAAAAARES
ncbi:hypothetical protein ZWY2020_025021 [Hordeum vulgare]|nr:hypothetical protein ZWY2020_025021 [Hordeum vulgare]